MATDVTSVVSLPAGFDDAAYLRVASMAVGAYELICTLPAEYRFYRQQIRRRTISQQCILFILIRYLSVIAVVVSNVGFFGRFPTAEACRRFRLVAPIFKSLQTLASELILSTRTYSVSRKARWVFWTMVGTLCFAVPVQFFTNIYKRTPVQYPTLNCISGNAGSVRIAWINYLVAMIFDLVAICISTGYLWVYSTTVTRLSHFIRILLYEGLGYFVILTAVNVLNLVLYLTKSEETQSTGASLGYVVIFIMSQRILIRQRDYAEKYASAATLPLPLVSEAREVSASRRLDTTREINEALRSQFEDSTSTAGTGSGSGFGSAGKVEEFGYTVTGPGPGGAGGVCQLRSAPAREWGREGSRLPDLEEEEEGCEGCEEEDGSCSRDWDQGRRRRPGSEGLEGLEKETGTGTGTGTGLDVQVRIERTVTVERNRAAGRRENYRRPRVMWER